MSWVHIKVHVWWLGANPNQLNCYAARLGDTII